MLKQVKRNLQAAQNRMTQIANNRHNERSFSIIHVIILVSFMSVSAVYCASLLHLERAFPLNNHGLELHQLKARDRLRHARLLQGFVGGVVDFSVQGSSDPYLVG